MPKHYKKDAAQKAARERRKAREAEEKLKQKAAHDNKEVGQVDELADDNSNSIQTLVNNAPRVGANPIAATTILQSTSNNTFAAQEETTEEEGVQFLLNQ